MKDDLKDDVGTATLEFVLVFTLLVSSFSAAVVQVTEAAVRQAQLQAIADTQVRNFSLARSADQISTLQKLLLEDSNLKTAEVALDLTCSNSGQCLEGEQVTAVVSRGNSRAASVITLHVDGSVLPLAIGLFALLFSLAGVGLNVAAVQLHQQRADSLARAVASEYVAVDPLPQQFRAWQFASAVEAQVDRQTQLESLGIRRADGLTTEVTLCLSYALPLRLLDFGAQGKSCAQVRMRNVG